MPCPGILILDSFFDGATPAIGGIVNTELTLVPCSENLGDPTVGRTFDVLAQMLIYNEFEQRLSTAVRVECFESTPPCSSAIRPAVHRRVRGRDARNLHRSDSIRGVQGSNGPLGFGLLGVATENYRTTPTGPILATDAFNLHNTGSAPTVTRSIERSSQPRPRERNLKADTTRPEWYHSGLFSRGGRLNGVG